MYLSINICICVFVLECHSSKTVKNEIIPSPQRETVELTTTILIKEK